jgi:hypothetical protein
MIIWDRTSAGSPVGGFGEVLAAGREAVIELQLALNRAN